MKNFTRILSILLAFCMVFGLGATVMAATVDDATIDSSLKASLTVYKYDITSAKADGAWETNSYVSTGAADTDVETRMAPYAIEGVEFTYLQVAEIAQHQAEGEIVVVYGFAKDDALLGILGLSADNRYAPADSLNADNYYFTSDTVNKALADALAANRNKVKNDMEAYIATQGTKMALTDATGLTTASNLDLGLYLLVETKVPENVTTTVNPFFVSLPMTTVDGTNADNGGQEWMYDVTVYPKNETGNPTLEKLLRESKTDTGKNTGSSAINDGYAHTATASAGDTVEYEVLSTLPVITSGSTYLTTYTFTDTLSAGLSYKKGDVKIEFFQDAACTVLKATWEPGSDKFTVAYADGANGEEIMTIAMTEAGLTEINTANTLETAAESGYSKYTVRVTYAAVANSDSSLVLGDTGNPNDVKLEWKRTSTAYSDELVDDCHLYAYGIDLTKTFSNNRGDFSKVKFVMQNTTDGYYVTADLIDGIYYVTGHVATEAEATLFTPQAQGEGEDAPHQVIVHGLEDDVYTITEVQTANGFVLLKEDILVAITAAESENICGIYDTDDNGLTQSLLPHKTLTASATIDANDGQGAVAVTMLADDTSVNAFVPMTVVNTSGVDLPQTGEIGAIWMPIIGAGIMVFGILACVVLLTRKKKEA